MYKIVNILISNIKDKNAINSILACLQEYPDLKYTISLYTDEIKKNTHEELYLLYLNDDEIKYFFRKNIDTKINIAILPNDKCLYSIKNYGISKELNEAVEDALNPELLSSVDLLKCNEVIAFNKIVIGDMHDINRYDFSKESVVEKIKIFFYNLNNLKFKDYTFKTSKDHKIKTVASGITILEHTVVSQRTNISEEMSFHDGKLNAFILAPTSLISYIYYLSLIFFYRNIKLATLPKSIGFIQSSKLSICSSKPIDYMLDGIWVGAKELELQVLQNTINIHLGRSLIDKVKDNISPLDEKDTIKLNSMPKGEIKEQLLDNHISLFKKASDDDFKDLFLNLRDSAKFSYVFLILMVLSTLLATTGLFSNSSPVIIGAMILAPLMSPIVSLSMGVIRAEKIMLQQSLRTLFIGIIMALIASSFYAFIMPLEQITTEMQSRINPTFLDLMVAVFAGIAGAYASSKEEVAKSLAGVAIAVALVPPLSVTGIGIGLFNLEVIYGSFLLFITNIVGITLSAALTFIVLGYAPVKRATKGIFYTSALMAIISIPLVLSFSKMIEENNFSSRLSSIQNITIGSHKVSTKVLSIKTHKDFTEIEIEVVSQNGYVIQDYSSLKKEVEKVIDKKVVLKIVPKVIMN